MMNTQFLNTFTVAFKISSLKDQFIELGTCRYLYLDRSNRFDVTSSFGSGRNKRRLGRLTGQYNLIRLYHDKIIYHKYCIYIFF